MQREQGEERDAPSGLANQTSSTVLTRARIVCSSSTDPPTLSDDWIASRTRTSVFSVAPDRRGRSFDRAAAACAGSTFSLRWRKKLEVQERQVDAQRGRVSVSWNVERGRTW